MLWNHCAYRGPRGFGFYSTDGASVSHNAFTTWNYPILAVHLFSWATFVGIIFTFVSTFVAVPCMFITISIAYCLVYGGMRDENDGFYFGWLDIVALWLLSLLITFNTAIALIYTHFIIHFYTHTHTHTHNTHTNTRTAHTHTNTHANHLLVMQLKHRN
jgi:hypothetical protein